MKNKNLFKKILKALLVITPLLLVLNGCGFQTSRQPKEKLNALQKKIQESADAVKTGAVSTTAFENAVNQKNYEEIGKLLADEVTYVVEASGCCGKITQEKAVAQLKQYLSTTDAFNFSQEQQIVKKLKVNIADQFENYTVGIASGKEVLAYKINSEGKVMAIYVVRH